MQDDNVSWRMAIIVPPLLPAAQLVIIIATLDAV
jgi:hypothetical protein